ncbi:MAG: hypothetical protein P8K77_03775 [Polaribacter sp.]|nr:hypothetical protein [Polaribacter sp.]
MLKRIFYIFLVFVSIKAVSQRTNSSPYSFFGIGQQYSSQTVEQVSMGGVGVAFSDSYHLNLMNPAGLANLRFAAYTFGLTVNDLTVKDFSGSQSSTSTSLSYVNIGFPIGKKAGMSFGLQPNTSVGYSLLNEVKDADGELLEVSRFFGLGGTSKIYGTFGMFLTKELSVGVEAEYVFGKTENTVLNQRTNVTLATNNTEETTLRGNGLKIGMQYTKELSNKLMLNFGATMKLQNSLTTNGEGHLYSSFSGSPRDTISSVTINGKIVSPLKTGLGIGIGKVGKWYAGLEYEFQDALSIQGSLLSESTSYAYSNSNKLSLGGFYLPKMNSISSYWDRVTYRAGLRFEKTGLLVSKTSTVGGFTEINDFGISFGLGLPMGKKISNLNLGVEYGKKGTTANDLIQENYFNLRLSLSLNDSWFVKRRID